VQKRRLTRTGWHDYSAFDFLRHLPGLESQPPGKGVICDQGPASISSLSVWEKGRESVKPCKLKVAVSICKETYPIEKSVSVANLVDFLAKAEGARRAG
jgi:hypothetical protein